MLCSLDDDCYQFQDLASWNEDFVKSLCIDDGLTDKSTTATLCGAFLGNVEYENSLKLAILNTMYGTGPIFNYCGFMCMYDPLNIAGPNAVGFKWRNGQGCWDVVVGATNRLCYILANQEYSWALSKTENWCCPDPTVEPTGSPLPSPDRDPTPVPSLNPTLSPSNGKLCSVDDDCYQFQDLASWNEDYVNSLCIHDGTTDKSTTATLCDPYSGNVEYENSLKLAILNTMYGTGPRPTLSYCGYYCMYDPLNIFGDAAIGFKWSNIHDCWNVVVGATNPLCYIASVLEWEWAVSKTQNWCCSSDPSPMPTNSPLSLPEGHPTPMPSLNPTLSPSNGNLCSHDDDCIQFQDLASWNEDYVNSRCLNGGLTDKSTTATLCDAYVGNSEYENSLKLAILNRMYGTGPQSNCGYFCMYDPLNMIGSAAVGFKWSNSKGCWNVLVGATDNLCYIASYQEWSWTVSKALRWCCPPGPPTPEPTPSPGNDMICSNEDDCYQWKELASWNQDHLTSLCTNDGNTDKSLNATLCSLYVGNINYENSLKLAILNVMYGTGAVSTTCPHYCMYDPLNIFEVGFVWRNTEGCWNVITGLYHPLCYGTSDSEWQFALEKTKKWCCP